MKNTSTWSRIRNAFWNREPKHRGRRRGIKNNSIRFEHLEGKRLLAVDLALEVGDADVEVEAGDSLVYTLNYSNSGDTAASGVTIRTWVPSNTTFDSAASDAAWSCGEDSFNCTLEVPSVAAGASGSVDFAVTVDSDLPSRVRQVSSFAIIGDDGANGIDVDRGNNFGVERTPVTRELHDLQITIADGDVEVIPGATIDYAIAYTNAGPLAANGAAISARLPSGTTLAPANTDPWICEDQNCTLDVGTLAADDGGTVTLSIVVDADLDARTRRVSASARIFDDGTGAADANPSNNFVFENTPINHQLPDLSLLMTDNDLSVSEGGSLAYTLSYTNEGTIAATGVTITQLVPSFTTFDSGSVAAAGWNCAEGVCTLDLGDLAGGATGTVIFPVLVDSEISARVRTIFSSARIADEATGGRDANRLNNADFERTPIVRALPDVSVDVDDADADVAPGGAINYTVSYANTGTVEANGVVITQLVPSNTSVDETAAALQGWSCEGSVCTLDVGNLPALTGAGTATFPVTVDLGISSRVRQIFASTRISDETTGGNDADRSNNSDFERTPVVHQVADLSLSVDGSDTAIAPGNTVLFTLDYANLGAAVASEVVLTMNVPRNTTFDAASSTTGWICDGRTCTLSVADVASAGATGDSGSAVFAVTIDSGISTLVRRIYGIARIADNGNDSNPLNNTSFDGVQVDHG